MNEETASNDTMDFVHGAASKAVDDQLSWMNDIDSKAGVLIGANGISVTFLFSQDALIEAPPWLASVVILLFAGSALAALIAFSPRSLDIPDFSDVVGLLVEENTLVAKRKHLEDLKTSFVRNEVILEQKADAFAWSGRLLLGAIAFLVGDLFVRIVQ